MDITKITVFAPWPTPRGWPQGPQLWPELMGVGLSGSIVTLFRYPSLPLDILAISRVSYEHNASRGSDSLVIR